MTVKDLLKLLSDKNIPEDTELVNPNGIPLDWGIHIYDGEVKWFVLYPKGDRH